MIGFFFFFFFRQTPWIDFFERAKLPSPLENPFTGQPAVHHPTLIAVSYKEQAVITRKNVNFIGRKCSDEVHSKAVWSRFRGRY